MSEKKHLLDLTTDIVAAYVSQNAVEPASLPDVINSVFETLDGIANPVIEEAALAPVPAVPIEQSMTDDYLICLEDGKQFKSLKRHLRTKFDLTPEAYREKWGLPHDYPMVAPSYAKERSKLAKKMGLGKSES